MALSKPREYLHVFRFAFELNGRTIGGSEVKWDGPCLVLTRMMERDHQTLYAELLDAGVDLRILLWTREHEVAQAWRVTYERLLDRGFEWLNAMTDDTVREAVALVNAHLLPDPARVAAG